VVLALGGFRLASGNDAKLANSAMAATEAANLDNTNAESSNSGLSRRTIVQRLMQR
jgi:hypothetical protein